MVLKKKNEWAAECISAVLLKVVESRVGSSVRNIQKVPPHPTPGE